MISNGKNKERMINEKKLKDRLIKSVEFAKEDGEYNDQPSWNYQQGVLLDYKEAEYICSLLDVVGQSEQCTRENEVQRQGNGFVYTVCGDCCEDLD